MYKQYTIECSNRANYIKPLKNEVKIVKIVAQDILEAIEKAQEEFSEYENFRGIRIENI